MDEQIKILYREILERFNKIIWTHKIHFMSSEYIPIKEEKTKSDSFSIFCFGISFSNYQYIQVAT